MSHRRVTLSARFVAIQSLSPPECENLPFFELVCLPNMVQKAWAPPKKTGDRPLVMSQKNIPGSTLTNRSALLEPLCKRVQEAKTRRSERLIRQIPGSGEDFFGVGGGGGVGGCIIISVRRRH